MTQKMLDGFSISLITPGLILFYLFMLSGGCSKTISRVVNTGLFENHESMTLAYKNLRDRFSAGETLTTNDIRKAGFTPEQEKNGNTIRVPGVEIYVGQEAFERYFGVSQQSLTPQSPEERAAEKTRWRIEKYYDIEMRGKRPYIFINTEESEDKGPEKIYTFVFRDLILADMPQTDIVHGSTESASGFLSGPVGGMGRITEGAGKGISAGF